ncbi:hypothetical protein EYF80_027970 [Liparis tanakae]|uniref:Uncharacterized protein n=1 Tax=Liparis tanakae TaxID=230148 RepID=A0A4Z2HA08_9TELE|nr:hypothetical protein EYF80_027970 [Liparis tanakae]
MPRTTAWVKRPYGHMLAMIGRRWFELRCLSSPAMDQRGSLHVTMYEKSCAVASQCGLSGQKSAAGLHFNYSNVCCDTELCNRAAPSAAPWRRAAAMSLLPALGLLLA